MRVKLTVQRLHCALEAQLHIDRGPSQRERAVWAAEEEHRFRATLEAIAEAPESAREIAERALFGGD